MWQMFTKVMPETTNEQSRAALTLLGMVGNIEPQIITSNINVLVEHGLNHNDLKGIFLFWQKQISYLKIAIIHIFKCDVLVCLQNPVNAMAKNYSF